jgi:hypothetical protein
VKPSGDSLATLLAALFIDFTTLSGSLLLPNKNAIATAVPLAIAIVSSPLFIAIVTIVVIC